MGLTVAAAGRPESVKETRRVSGFNKINFGVAGDLYISFGQEFKVELEGDKSLLEEISTEVSGGKLTIRKDTWHSFSNQKVVVYVTMPEIKGLGVSGSGKAELREPVKADELDLSVSGSGRILTTDLKLGSLNVEISGSGNVIIGGSGEAAKADVSISGSGNFDGEPIRVSNAHFSISGSGSSRCNVTENLEARVSGSGSVTYTGNPKVDARVSGSGRVRSK